MNFSPEMIGVGKYTGELARWLVQRGHAIEVVTAQPHYPGFVPQTERSHRYRRTFEDGLAVTRCPLLLREGGRGIWRLVAPLSFALTAAPILLWRALRFRPSVVLCVEPTLFAAPVSMLAARIVGAKLVLHVQDLELDAAFATNHLRGRVLRRVGAALESRLLRAFDAVVTISDAMAQRLAAKGVDRLKLTVTRNWLRSTQRPRPQDVERLRDSLGIERGEQVVLYAGHLGAKQDVPMLLAALAKLSRRRGLRIVVAGAGPMAPLIAAAGLPNLIQLPLQSPDAYETLLALADVHVLPQAARASDLVFPSKLGPMLGTGRHVVVTASPDSELARWIAGAALVAPPGDPAAFASAIAAALDEPSHARCREAEALASSLDAQVLLPAFEACLMGWSARPGHGTEAAISWPVGSVDAATSGMAEQLA